jgi:hypothetical protein
MKKLTIALLITILSAGALSAEAGPWRGGTLGFAITVEYSPSFDMAWTIALTGEVRLEAASYLYRVKAGIGFWSGAFTNMPGRTVMEANAYVGAGADFPLSTPFQLDFIWQFNGIPTYDSYANTIYPSAQVGGRWGALSLGAAFRWFNIGISEALFQAVPAFVADFYALNDQRAFIGIGLRNADDWRVRNLSAFYLHVFHEEHFHDFPGLLFTMSNDIRLFQTGSAGLTAMPDGFSYTAKGEVQWGS